MELKHGTVGREVNAIPLLIVLNGIETTEKKPQRTLSQTFNRTKWN